MMVAIEQHVNWVGDCLVQMRERGIVEIEASNAARDEWADHVNETAEATLYPRADSWYVGANVPGKARVFMLYVAGQGPYKEICDRIAGHQYEGFELAS